MMADPKMMQMMDRMMNDPKAMHQMMDRMMKNPKVMNQMMARCETMMHGPGTTSSTK